MLCSMGIYLTASDLARIYRVELGTIYSWASRDNWRRTGTWPRRYHVDDAQASHDRRYHVDDAQASHERRKRRHPRPPTVSGFPRPRQTGEAAAADVNDGEDTVAVPYERGIKASTVPAACQNGAETGDIER